ncbi:polysaccharide synthesis phosphatase [Pusillimonas sp. T7-7]|uniref:D-glycero-beta-D-manno-heptose 1,7-bisphosphate 7-phosphatase n=1 Tax=Pusillimonas sp. (strain T7-7) TaxID=1007105 RepID=UPI00020857A5|nr:D-glycero-beta-D-manno-heptose 1,7-bisphosphate 7-phosphatase [Pusillimonas sp. T7-7]AEC18589.1 polysaccharide synthesis phosphatase [Pusillimonas sp. T7-7]
MKLAILDRDGVINQDSDAFVKSPDEWIALPGSVEAIARLSRAGWRVVIASNQSGIARGLFSMDTLNAIHAKLRREVIQAGGVIDAIFVCPHGPDDGCTCRKPKPGMFLDIARRYDMADLHGVPAVGDSLRDLQAAAMAGCSPWLVLTGNGQNTQDKGELPTGTHIADNLAAVVKAWLSEELT